MVEDVTEIGVLRETAVLEEAADGTTVRLIGQDGAVDVRLTDGSAVAFVGLAEEVFDGRHADVVDREDRFNVHPDDVDGTDDRRDR